MAKWDKDKNTAKAPAANAKPAGKKKAGKKKTTKKTVVHRQTNQQALPGEVIEKFDIELHEAGEKAKKIRSKFAKLRKEVELSNVKMVELMEAKGIDVYEDDHVRIERQPGKTKIKIVDLEAKAAGDQ